MQHETCRIKNEGFASEYEQTDGLSMNQKESLVQHGIGP